MTNETKCRHSTGPWTVVDTVKDGCRIDTPTGTVAESVYWWPDAHLMRAAPELYALARRVAEHFEYTDAPLGEEARRIIATIEGAD